MLIGGLQKLSLVDYPGKSCIALFTIGCNFRCPFCHNPELVLPERFPSSLDTQEVLDFIKSRQGLVEAVTISGGEPTLQSDLADFIKQIKEMGFLVKLDTNGTQPQVLERLFADKLLDFVAMDIKNSFANYSKTVGVEADIERLKSSIELIKNSGKDYEFRTTIIDRLHQVLDFEDIGKQLTADGQKIKRFALQHFRPAKTLDPDYSTANTLPEVDFEMIRRLMLKYADEVIIH